VRNNAESVYVSNDDWLVMLQIGLVDINIVVFYPQVKSGGVFVIGSTA
jgi:hypothetical protein